MERYKVHVDRVSEMEFPPTTTQPNMRMGRKSLMGEERTRLPASGTPRVGLCHSGSLASACVLCLSFKSSCPEFT